MSADGYAARWSPKTESLSLVEWCMILTIATLRDIKKGHAMIRIMKPPSLTISNLPIVKVRLSLCPPGYNELEEHPFLVQFMKVEDIKVALGAMDYKIIVG